jgi:hypothetical protein
MPIDPRPSTFWKPPNFGWGYWNYAIIGVGLIVGFCVWFVPDKRADPVVAAQIAKRIEQQKQAKAYKAEQDRIAAENEELGLVYIEPGTNPFLPPEGLKDAPKDK